MGIVNMSTLLSYTPLLLQGVYVTMAAWCVAGSISLVIGTCLGIASSQRIGSKPVIIAIRIYSFITRGIPAYVQILIGYFVIPSITGLDISGFTAATCALGICASGYVTEIVRGGINAIAQGQWDSCYALGFSLSDTVRHIILPQALKIMTPSLIGEYEQLVKSTSLLAAIGVTELTRAGMNIISRELNPLPVYCTIACFYLLFSAIFNLLIIYCQQKNE